MYVLCCKRLQAYDAINLIDWLNKCVYCSRCRLALTKNQYYTSLYVNHKVEIKCVKVNIQRIIPRMKLNAIWGNENSRWVTLWRVSIWLLKQMGNLSHKVTSLLQNTIPFVIVILRRQWFCIRCKFVHCYVILPNCGQQN